MNKNVRKTNKEFESEVYSLYGDEYTVLGEYVSNKTDILLLHNKCGKEFTKKPYHFLNRRQGCTHCSKGTRKNRNTEWFQNKLNDIFGEGVYIVKGEYINQATPIEVYTVKCKHTNYPNPNNLLNKKFKNPPCYECTNRKLKTQEQFEKEIYSLVKDEYTVIGKYINSNTKIEMIHNKCNHKWFILPHNFTKKGNRCPKCMIEESESKGVKRIKEYLNTNNIRYETEYTFTDCKYKDLLPFDFYLNDFNLLIEFDGAFHFKPFNNSDESIKKFKDQQIRDAIKNNYCKNNGINLLRIKYTEENLIEDILNKIIS